MSCPSDLSLPPSLPLFLSHSPPQLDLASALPLANPFLRKIDSTLDSGSSSPPSPMAQFYSIDDILRVACEHPFYNPSSDYPPDSKRISSLIGLGEQNGVRLLSEQPLLHKDQLNLALSHFETMDPP